MARAATREPTPRGVRARGRASATASPIPALLRDALTHPSYAHERGEGAGNERLEFLGDAVLGLAIGEAPLRPLPRLARGPPLARARRARERHRARRTARARSASASTRASAAASAQGGGAEKRRILANVFEAVVGALYLDGGIEPRGRARRARVRARASPRATRSARAIRRRASRSGRTPRAGGCRATASSATPASRTPRTASTCR